MLVVGKNRCIYIYNKSTRKQSDGAGQRVREMIGINGDCRERKIGLSIMMSHVYIYIYIKGREYNNNRSQQTEVSGKPLIPYVSTRHECLLEKCVKEKVVSRQVGGLNSCEVRLNFTIEFVNVLASRSRVKNRVNERFIRCVD